MQIELREFCVVIVLRRTSSRSSLLVRRILYITRLYYIPQIRVYSFRKIVKKLFFVFSLYLCSLYDIVVSSFENLNVLFLCINKMLNKEVILDTFHDFIYIKLISNESN